MVALLLFGLQMVFGLLSAAKYLGPDPLLHVLPFDVAKEIHTNLLLVWLITAFMGATYYLVPEESRVELHSVRLAYLQLVLWTAMGVTGVVGYVFGWTAGNKLLEQPFPLKVVIVIVMLMFLYNIVMTIWSSGRLTTTEGVLVAGLACSALLYLPALLEFDNYTVSVFYRWWTVHLWVEGVWEMIQGALLAYLLVRLSGADREVMEKWLYVIVGLTFISGILGTAHHYYWIGVPPVLAAHRRALQRPGARLVPGHGDVRLLRHAPLRPGAPEYHGAALDHRERHLLGARRGHPGLAHTWPAVNKWTHGTLITPMHGHMAFFGAYVMIVLGMITYALPALTGKGEDSRETAAGLWAFWLQVAGMFGMTMAFAAAGLTQTYLERIMGIGYLDTQLKLQVHFLMLVATGALFVVGVALYLWDFFFVAGRPLKAGEETEGLAAARPVV